MERLPVELLYVLAFVGFMLFNFFAQRAARRRQQEEAAQAPAEPPPPSADDALLEDVWGRTPAPAAPAPPAPAPVLPAALAPRPVLPVPRAPAPPPRLHPTRALLKDRRDLRTAVVLTMVLGPCRAQEPPDARP